LESRVLTGGTNNIFKNNTRKVKAKRFKIPGTKRGTANDKTRDWR
jgi:hypothetical protein